MSIEEFVSRKELKENLKKGFPLYTHWKCTGIGCPYLLDCRRHIEPFNLHIYIPKQIKESRNSKSEICKSKDYLYYVPLEGIYTDIIFK